MIEMRWSWNRMAQQNKKMNVTLGLSKRNNQGLPDKTGWTYLVKKGIKKNYST